MCTYVFKLLYCKKFIVLSSFLFLYVDVATSMILKLKLVHILEYMYHDIDLAFKVNPFEFVILQSYVHMQGIFVLCYPQCHMCVCTYLCRFVNCVLIFFLRILLLILSPL